MLVDQALVDAPKQLAAATTDNVDRLPECGFAITAGGRLVSDPGCCSSMSSVLALVELLVDPGLALKTVFTGHDAMRFVQTGQTAGVLLKVRECELYVLQGAQTLIVFIANMKYFTEHRECYLAVGYDEDLL